ncbi:Hypothetical protein A7982_00400 [Minicystis rosea]|nr:Hypothetical protein A7982_00400 [Minicystis rosea]
MPVSAHQIAQLDTLMKNHSAKIAKLNREVRSPSIRNNPAEVKRLNREIRKHQEFVRLGQDPLTLSALNELTDNPALRQKALKDPTAFVRQKGIKLPPGSKVVMKEYSPRWSIGVDWDDSFVGYDSDTGFSSG